MKVRTWHVLLLCLLTAVGCSKKKSTDDLLVDMKAPHDEERIVAVRTLSQRQGDAEQVVPALILGLKDKSGEVRKDSAIGLGSFGPQARDAIAALKEAQHDKDTRVREAAGVALSRIEP
jgi:HEAT repeat protein